jgi:transcriptional regulator with XRE-family HTH domain
MIKNDRQYRITRTRAEEFERALLAASGPTEPSSKSLFRQIQKEAIESQLNDLKSELQQYELLKNGKIRTLEIESLAELPEALIRARIARGWTQKKLAHELGLKEQQVQRYEADDYATASVERVKSIAAVLGLELDKAVLKAAARTSLDQVFGRLEDVGLHTDFVESRLIPEYVRAKLEHLGKKGSTPDVLVAEIATRISKIFGWSVDAILGKGMISVDQLATAEVRFKLPKTADERAVSAYTVYAHYVALLALQCTPKIKYVEIPSDPIALRKAIVGSEGCFDFESVLRFLWRRGIVVIPLRDKGMFHAAYWRVDGRHVIVLKQRTNSLARWLIDLLHEVRHVLSKPEERNLSIIDADGVARPEADYLDEEEEATEFAGECALEGSAEMLVHAAHVRSKQNLRNLKSAVTEIARERHADLGLFANYMAYRLSLQGINWWGSATNLQTTEESPWDSTRRVFLEHADLQTLNEFDREVFLQALKED